MAIPLEETIKRRIAALRQSLSDLSSVRWTPSENLHLTLKFLGDTPDRMAAKVAGSIRDAAASVSPLDLDVRGVGCFPSSGPVRVIWVGAAADSGLLTDCMDKCESALAELGFKPEARSFHAHVTIARNKSSRESDSIRGRLAEVGDFEGGRQTADRLVLFESRQKSSGPRYIEVASAPLGVVSQPSPDNLKVRKI